LSSTTVSVNLWWISPSKTHEYRMTSELAYLIVGVFV